MPFGLCDAPTTFQIYMMTIFYNFLGDSLELFMDEFSVFGHDFDGCISHVKKICVG